MFPNKLESSLAESVLNKKSLIKTVCNYYGEKL